MSRAELSRKTGKILRVVHAEDNPDVLTHAEVRTSDNGRYRAVLGPGLYKAIKAGALKPGDEVLLCMQPIPTLVGVLVDG